MRQRIWTTLTLLVACCISGCGATPVVDPIEGLITDATSRKACLRHFADETQARSVGELVCSAWEVLSRHGDVRLHRKVATPDATGAWSLTVATQLVGEPNPVTEDFQVKTNELGKITEINASDTLWGTQPITVTKTGDDLLVGAEPKWVAAWDQARAALASGWAKDRLPKGLVVEFPQRVSVFLTRARLAQTVDTGAVTVQYQKTTRIVVNPVAISSESPAVAALLAHELTHVAWAECAHEPLWVEEGFAQWQAWQVHPEAKAEATVRVGADETEPTTEDFDDPKTTRGAYDRAGLAVTRAIDKEGVDAFVKRHCG